MIDNNKTCRICMGNNAITDIFTAKKRHHSYKNMINALFSFKIDENDGLPNKLCKKCSLKVVASHNLKCLAEKTNEELSKHLAIENKNITKNENPLYPLDTWLDIKEEINITDVSEGQVSFIDYSECEEDTEQGVIIDSNSKYDEDTNVIEEHVKNENQETIKEENISSEENSSNDSFPLKRNGVKLKKGKKKEKRISIVCDICGKSVINIKDHRLIHLPNKRVFPCESCPKVFQSRSSRRFHVNIKHLGLRYYCQICKKFYSVTKTDHNRICHSDRGRDFQCSYCDMKFFSKYTLKQHISTHTKEKPHLCTVCGKGFSNVTEAKYHKRNVHDKEKQHICQYCSKAYFFSSHLKEHIRVHTSGGFKCPECGKVSSSNRSLKQHLKLHGKKHIKCGLCDKEFFTNGNLNLHMISHTKEKKHACKYCGIKFGRTDHRNRHEKTAHESKIKD